MLFFFSVDQGINLKESLTAEKESTDCSEQERESGLSLLLPCCY